MSDNRNKIVIQAGLDKQQTEKNINNDIKQIEKKLSKIDIVKDDSGRITKIVEKYNAGLNKTLTITKQINKETEQLEITTKKTSNNLERTNKRNIDYIIKQRLEQEKLNKSTAELYQKQFAQKYNISQPTSKNISYRQDGKYESIWEDNLLKIDKERKRQIDSNLKSVQNSYNLEQKEISKTISLRQKELEVMKQQARERIDANSVSRLGTQGYRGSSSSIYTSQPILNAIGSNFQLSGKSAKESAGAFDELFKKAEKSKVGLTNVEKKVVDLNPKLAEGSKQAKSYGENLLMVGKKFADWLIVGGVIFGAINQIQQLITFTNQLNKAQTNIAMITGKSRTEINGMTKDYIQLASTLHDTTSSVMSAAEEFLRAGRNQEEAMSMVTASTIMSKIAGQNQKETADQLIAITNGYKMSIEDTMGVVDKLTTVDNASATSTKELGLALERTSASAQGAGITFEKLVSWIATVSSITRKNASSIGESFKFRGLVA